MTKRLILNLIVLLILYLTQGIAFADPEVPPKANNEAQYDIIIATPNQCVALNRGQVCYQEVTLVWRSATVGDYCVRSSQQDKPLRCWQGQQEGELALEVEANKSVLFTLNDNPADNKLAEALMRVAWVYQQKRRKIASWRLF